MSTEFTFAVPAPRLPVSTPPIDIPVQSPCVGTPRMNRYPLKQLTCMDIMTNTTTEAVKIMKQWEGYTPALISQVRRRKENMQSILEEEEKTVLQRLEWIRVQQSLIGSKPIHIDDPKRPPPAIQFHDILYINHRAFFLQYQNVTTNSMYRIYDVVGAGTLHWRTRNGFETDLLCGKVASGPPLTTYVAVDNHKTMFVGEKTSYSTHESGVCIKTGVQIGHSNHVVVLMKYNHEQWSLQPYKVFINADTLRNTPMAF